jgi:hypothetical protein
MLATAGRFGSGGGRRWESRCENSRRVEILYTVVVTVVDY